MQNWSRQLALCFSAGSVGALAKNGAVFVCARFAISAGLVSHLTNAQYPSGFYARIVWGGLAAFLFLLPLVRNSWVMRGLFWGAVAAVLQIFVVPLLEHATVHFALVPVLSILALTCIWGLATAIALRLFGA